MPIKKSNIVGVNLSDEAIFVLQQLGYMNKAKKAQKGMNLSKFVNKLVLDCIDFDPKLDKNRMMLDVLKKRMMEKQVKRDTIETDIDVIAKEMSKLRSILNIE